MSYIDHIGLIEKVDGSSASIAKMAVIKGNKNNSVSRRIIAYRAAEVTATVRPSKNFSRTLLYNLPALPVPQPGKNYGRNKTKLPPESTQRGIFLVLSSAKTDLSLIPREGKFFIR